MILSALSYVHFRLMAPVCRAFVRLMTLVISVSVAVSINAQSMVDDTGSSEGTSTGTSKESAKDSDKQSNSAAHAKFAQMLLQHRQQGKPIPLFSQYYHQSSADSQSLINKAYDVQKHYVELRQNSDNHNHKINERIIGYKAGLTSAAGQAKFAISEPLSGVLFNSGTQPLSSDLHRSQFGQLMVETELGFRLNTSVTTPITSVAELKSLVAFVLPVIELPDLGFAKPDMSQSANLTGADIIAANVAAHSFIFGPEIPINHTPDLNQLSVSLTRDGKTINQGKGSDALGDQWQALLWLVNQLIAQGYSITDEQVLITGALGQMLPAKVGQYRAEFGPLGHVNFSVKE